jgi:hypothetical protein
MSYRARLGDLGSTGRPNANGGVRGSWSVDVDVDDGMRDGWIEDPWRGQGVGRGGDVASAGYRAVQVRFWISEISESESEEELGRSMILASWCVRVACAVQSLGLGCGCGCGWWYGGVAILRYCGVRCAVSVGHHTGTGGCQCQY